MFPLSFQGFHFLDFWIGGITLRTQAAPTLLCGDEERQLATQIERFELCALYSRTLV